MTDHPTAPVQDDDADAKTLRRVASQLRTYSDMRGALEVERIASRLSPTPETGLVEALTPFARYADIQDGYGRGDDEGFCSTTIHAGGKKTRLTCGDLRRVRTLLSNVLPDEV